jgi:hypothetical protein
VDRTEGEWAGEAQDALTKMARELPDLAGRIATMKDEAAGRLHSPEYDALRLRLEVAHSAVEAAAVEARRRVRLSDRPGA